MSEKTELQKVSEETIRFMRGKYRLDEVPCNIDSNCIKFRQGKKTILTIYIHDDRYDFLLIFGKNEREKFDAQRDVFLPFVQQIYDSSKTYHDGKWMLIPVADLETLEAVKKLILIKKKPNRKPFPKEQAIYGDCGHRCDLCIHYTGDTMSETLRNELKERLTRVYGDWGEDMMLCPGCHNKPSEDCSKKRCAKANGCEKCRDHDEYPCKDATAGWPPKIELKHVLADDVTWAILPYVDRQYGN